jgi:ADP-ribose pyrophosphatase
MSGPLLRLLKRTTIFAHKFLRVEEHEFELRTKDGPWEAPQSRFVLDRGDSVAALLLDRDAGVVHLVRQFRYVTFDPTKPDEPGNGWLLELPAGTLEPGESPEACIIREVEEETGFVIDGPRLIGRFYPSAGALTEKMHLFVAEVSPARRASARADGHYGVGDEVIQTVALPIPEFLARIARMDIADAKTIAAAEWLRRDTP